MTVTGDTSFFSFLPRGRLEVLVIKWLRLEHPEVNPRVSKERPGEVPFPRRLLTFRFPGHWKRVLRTWSERPNRQHSVKPPSALRDTHNPRASGQPRVRRR